MNIVEDITKTTVTRHISVQLDEQVIIEQLQRQVTLPDGFKVKSMTFADSDLGALDINEVMVDVVIESTSVSTD